MAKIHKIAAQNLTLLWNLYNTLDFYLLGEKFSCICFSFKQAIPALNLLSQAEIFSASGQ